MADKKRTRKDKNTGTKTMHSRMFNTFDDQLEHIRQETLSSVVEREIYPMGRAYMEETEDDTQIYYTEREHYKKTGRYEQSPDVVAQHMQDRTQFRH